ncbi:MAG: hypothetical protein JHC82_00310 [Stenotrophomonas sp.]|nr:hypothetical protein [Stenotrophomonas sp.]
MHPDETFSISLRIWHPVMPAQEMIEAVGLEPRISQSVGLRRATPAGEFLDGFYRASYCNFRLVMKAPGRFTEALAPLLDQLGGNRDIFRQIALTGGRTELYVGVFVEGDSGFTLAIDDISRMAELSLELSVEVYP